MDETQQVAWKWYPVTIQQDRSVTAMMKLLGGGLRTQYRVIRDRTDPDAVKPSELLWTLCCGWSPMFDPSSVILTRNAVPSQLVEFENFEVHLAHEGATVIPNSQVK
jgi:hypothetical protein